MRPFQGLDPTALKAFYFAAQELNFTRAAELASLTQSGISQHVKRLEDELGMTLLERNQKRMRLTEAGHELKTFVEVYLDQVDSLLDRLQRQSQSLKGKVSYAMPDSCLFTPHFPLLLDRRAKEYPGIELQVRICDSEEVVAALLKGDIDFGFITKRLASPELELKEFAREEYVYVAREPEWLELDSAQDLKSIPFLHYPGMDVLFDHWFETEFPKAKTIRLSELQLIGSINSLRGAIQMVEKGVGAAVFQKHCVLPQLEAKSIFARPARNSRPPLNPIYVVTRAGQNRTARVEAVLNTFWSMKKAE